jgi:hypothetical protein
VQRRISVDCPAGESGGQPVEHRGKIKPTMPYEFIEGADELEPQPGSSRSGGPPRKSTLAGVHDPQRCPRCGKQFPSKHEESTIRKLRADNAKHPGDKWVLVREVMGIWFEVCMCQEPTSKT